MSEFTIPELESGELTPWRPSERSAIKQRLLFGGNVADEDLWDLQDYLDILDKRFVITGVGVQAVKMAVGHMGFGAHVFYPNDHVGQNRDEVQREFEQDILSLEPTGYANGLRHRESRAGFGGGEYPTEAFANLIGSNSKNLNTILKDKTAMLFGHVLVKYDNFLAPVVPHPHSPDLVHADRAEKLSETGEALLDIALHIADYSTKDR